MRPPEGVERDFPLARLTTVRAGGNADLFARPRDEDALACELVCHRAQAASAMRCASNVSWSSSTPSPAASAFTVPPHANDNTPGINSNGVASSGLPKPIVSNNTVGCAYVA